MGTRRISLKECSKCGKKDGGGGGGGVANFRIWCHVTVANRATCPPDITELSTVFTD